jgi:hypothetical protein
VLAVAHEKRGIKKAKQHRWAGDSICVTKHENGVRATASGGAKIAHMAAAASAATLRQRLLLRAYEL